MTVPGNDSLREQVRAEAEAAIEERLDSGTPQTGSAPDTPTELAQTGWDTSDYNSFFADCREAGHDASTCGDLWGMAKEAGLTPNSPEPADDTDDSGGEEAAGDDDGAHVLLVKEEHEGSDVAVQFLGEAIADEKIDAATVDSEFGEEIIDRIDGTIQVPAHIYMDDTTVETRPLDALFDQYGQR